MPTPSRPRPPQLNAACSGEVLFGEPSVKGPLVALMTLELRCVRQWYPGPGTRAFFEGFAGKGPRWGGRQGHGGGGRTRPGPGPAACAGRGFRSARLQSCGRLGAVSGG
jgi:hypothetical protein